jgi:hypothetical protein
VVADQVQLGQFVAQTFEELCAPVTAAVIDCDYDRATAIVADRTHDLPAAGFDPPLLVVHGHDDAE